MFNMDNEDNFKYENIENKDLNEKKLLLKNINLYKNIDKNMDPVMTQSMANPNMFGKALNKLNIIKTKRREKL